ncbi:hypothetical protein pb186bvf_005379 [Paramecium bursaria]
MLNNLKCQMRGHENENIKSICINENCRQPLRRVCYKCLREELHHQDQNFKRDQIVDEGDLKALFQQFRNDIKTRLEQIEIQYLIQQKLAIQDILNGLERFYSINDLLQDHKSNQILQFNEQEYLNELIQNNMGIKQFFKIVEQKVQKLEIQKVKNLKWLIQNQVTEGSEINDNFQQLPKNEKQKENIGSICQKSFMNYDQSLQNRLLSSMIVFQKKHQNSIDNTVCQFFIQEEKNIPQVSRLIIKFITQKLMKDPYNQDLLSLRCKIYVQQEKYLERSQVSQKVPHQQLDIIPIHQQQSYVIIQNPQPHQHQPHQYQPQQQPIQLPEAPQQPLQIKQQEQLEDQHFTEGLMYMESENYDQAIMSFKKAIQLQKTFDYAYYQMGLAYFELAKYEQALVMFEKAIEINKKDLEYFVKAGLTYLNLERYNEAIIMEDKALQLDPNLWYAYFIKGKSYQKLKNYSSAIQIFNKSIQLKKDWPLSHYNLGLCYFEKQQYENAVIAYKAAIDLKNDDPEYFIECARALYDLKNYTDPAIEMCFKAIQLDDKSFKPFFYLGLLYQQKNSLDEALKYYNKSLQINQLQSSAYNNKGTSLKQIIGNILRAKKQYIEALQCFNQAIELSPDEVLYYRNKGNCLLDADQNKEAEALKVFETALLKDPNDENILFGKGKCLLKLAKFDQASVVFQRLQEINPNNCAYFYAHGNLFCLNLGLLQQQLKKYEIAVKSYDKAIQIKQNEIDFYKQKANCFELMGKNDLAIITYKRALQIEPNNQGLQQALNNCINRQINQQQQQLQLQLQSIVFRIF